MKIFCANWQAADDAELELAHYPDIEFILQRTPPGSLTPVEAEALADADAVINYSATQHVGAKPAQFAKARVAVRAGVGFDNLDLAGWGAKGVPVCNVPDYGTTEVADHAIADPRYQFLRAKADRRWRRRLALRSGAAGSPASPRYLRRRRTRPHRARRRPACRGLRHEGGVLRSLPLQRRRPVDGL